MSKKLILFPALLIQSLQLSSVYSEPLFYGKYGEYYSENTENKNGKSVLLCNKKQKLNQNKLLSEQIKRDNTIYEIYYDFDLRERHQVSLNVIKVIDGKSYYSHNKGIELQENQCLWIPENCIILDKEKNKVISSNDNYRPKEKSIIYIAAKKETEIEYLLEGSITIPNGSTLAFKGGSFSHGSVDFNGCIIKGEPECFNSIDVLGESSSKAYVNWFSDKDDTKKIQSAFLLSRDIVFDEQEYHISSNILVKGREEIRIEGNNATIKALSSTYCSFEDCSNIIVCHLKVDGSFATPRFFIFSGCNKINIENCYFSNIGGANIGAGVYCCCFMDSYDIVVKKCVFKDIEASETNGSARGLYFAFDKEKGEKCHDIIINKCEFNNIHAPNSFKGKGKDDTDCIYVSGIYVGDGEAKAIIKDCSFIDYGKRGVKAQARGVNVVNCRFLDVDKEKRHHHWRAVELFGSNSCVKKCEIRVRDVDRAIQIYNEGVVEVSNGVPSVDKSFTIENVTISDNKIIKEEMNSVSYGIAIGDDNDNLCEYNDITINNNIISGVYSGIRVTGYGNNVEISNNTINSTNNGILIISSDVTGEVAKQPYSFTSTHTNYRVTKNELRGNYSGDSNKYKGTAIQFDCIDSEISKNKVDNYLRGIMSNCSNVNEKSNVIKNVRHKIITENN